MTRREWMERHFGARPTKLPQSALQARVRQLQGMLAAARKMCHAVEKWDAIEAAVRMFGRDRPGDT